MPLISTFGRQRQVGLEARVLVSPSLLNEFQAMYSYIARSHFKKSKLQRKLHFIKLEKSKRNVQISKFIYHIEFQSSE